MVTIDLDAIRRDIETWDDERLIRESVLHSDHYSDEVRVILDAECERRNLRPETVAEKAEVIAKDESAAEAKRYSGIRGWLLFYIIGQFISLIVFIFGLVYAKDVPQAVSFAFFAAVTSVILVCIFLKKKSGVRIIKGCLLVLFGLGVLTLLSVLITGSMKGLNPAISLIVHSSIWFTYFKVSKRVRYTFIR